MRTKRQRERWKRNIIMTHQHTSDMKNTAATTKLTGSQSREHAGIFQVILSLVFLRLGVFFFFSISKYGVCMCDSRLNRDNITCPTTFSSLEQCARRRTYAKKSMFSRRRCKWNAMRARKRERAAVTNFFLLLVRSRWAPSCSTTDVYTKCIHLWCHTHGVWL